MASSDRDGYDSDQSDDFNPAPAAYSDDEQDDTESRRDIRASTPRANNDDEDDGNAGPSSNKAKPSRDVDEDDVEDVEDVEDEDEEEEETNGRRNVYDDEDDEDEEEEEDDVQGGHRRKRRRDKRAAFFDIEAEVDDEDEDEVDEREGEEIEGFIDHEHPDDVADSGRFEDDRRHRELDRRREVEQTLDAEKQAEILRQRYGKRAAAKGMGEGAVVPKRLLLPSVDDPGIWAVRCKEGKEREVIFSIMKRIEERLNTKDELNITSAFERGGPNSVMKGYIYVEARRQTDILTALDGMLNVYPRTKMMLVEIKDMPDLLRIAKTPTLEPGAFVRLRRPAKHAGDLAQVLNVTENGLEARVRFIPRLDYGANDPAANLTADGKRKRPLPGVPGPRPPQKLFSEIEARKHNYRHLTGSAHTGVWNYNGDEFENGFQCKDIKIQQLVVKDVNPKLEEVTPFKTRAEDGTENLDLKALAASLKDSNTDVQYLPGDVIEVYEGEQAGVVGKATHVQGDIVTLHVTEGGLKGQTIEVPTKGLRKRFKEGDHVKVIGGSSYRDEVGMVVNVVNDRVILLTDQNTREITVFSRNLREADDIGGQGSLGQYSLLDLVELNVSTVGVIVKVDRESLVVLDQFGATRQITPSQIANKIPKNRSTVAADRNGSEIRLDDVVREANGERRQGKILHIRRSFVFLHSNSTTENAGVFVARASNVNTIAAKGGRINAAATTGPDLNSMNPALKRNPNGNSQMAPPKPIMGRDRAINQTVTIRRGGWKGLLGIVKDTTDTHARVELHTKSKTITVPKADLIFKDKVTGQVIDISRGGRGGFRGGRGGFGGSNLDAHGGSRTPAAGNSSERTPAWGGSRSSSSHTPAWARGDSGGRTPAWAPDGSRTVNPYDGNRTAYGGSGSRTPAWSSGGKTPAPGGDSWSSGSKTPAYGGGGDSWNSGSKTPAYGASAPTPGASGNDPWGYTSGPSGAAYDAPTPGAGLLGAPTPGAFNAPTPGAYAAPTPAALNAPTPSGGWANWDAAPTPAAGAPTPGASGFASYSAPTPGAYVAPETPAASGPRYTDD